MPNADLLLLNASNYPGQPIYPYAFVQVTALARQYGITVKPYDFLGTPRVEWSGVLQDLVGRWRPRMIGFHIRQVDNQIVSDYHKEGTSGATAYFPVADTKVILDMVRGISPVPIVIGGFAVSVHARLICDFLRPDYGVHGAPDDFFANFEAIATGNIGSIGEVANLIWKNGDEYIVGPQEHRLPLSTGEYDASIFSDMCAFYAKHGRRLSFGRLGEVDVPIEVMRGCPCRCYFCTEPSVKGRRSQKRDLDAVIEDVMFLAERDIRSVWFICSEINVYGMEFPLEIAARMERLNLELGSRRMLWKAYAMPRPGMSFEDLRYMMSAGYIPGWNEFTSLDDDNLKACGMPYRTKDVIRYFKDVLTLSRDRSVYHGPPFRKFEMFLGNAHITSRAMRNTLGVVDREGLGEEHDFGGATSATRVYEIDGKLTCGSIEDILSLAPDGRLSEVNTLYPTFYEPAGLLEVLGTCERVNEFLAYVSSTFLSRNFRLTLDTPSFLASAISAKRFAELLRVDALAGLVTSMHIAAAASEMMGVDRSRETRGWAAAVEEFVEAVWRDPNEFRIRALYDPVSVPYSVRSRALEIVLSVLFKLNAEAFEPVYERLGLEDPEDRKTPYRIMRQLYKEFESREDLFNSVCYSCSLDLNSLQLLQLRHLVFVNNVRIEKEYGPLLFDQVKALS